MKTYSLSEQEELLLVGLIGLEASLIVWDINAIYVVADRIIKIEAIAATPESPEPNDFDEIFPIEVCEDASAPIFKVSGDPGYLYQVLAEQEQIVGVDLVSVGIAFPDDELFYPDSLPPGDGSNIVVCGIVLHLANGSVLPAYQEHPSFGFDTHPGRKLYAAGELTFSQPYKVVPLARMPPNNSFKPKPLRGSA